MKATLLVAALVSSLLGVQVQPANAALASIEVNALVGFGFLSDSSFLTLHVFGGDVTIGNKPPTTVDQGGFDLCTGATVKDTLTCVQQKLNFQTCSIVAVANDCSQATIECGPQTSLTQHVVVGMIPNTTFFGSFDGIDMLSPGSISLQCIVRQIPPAPARTR